MTLPAIIALIMLAALTLYALLGGADYGGGVWDLLARGPRTRAQRDLIAHAIGPVWEANHVWLILVIVILFTAFPGAFHAVMVSLHLPISLMLVGIVLRGTAFTFRTYDTSAGADRRWNHRFSIPSVITPVLLGAIIGSIATGRIETSAGEFLWLRPFPIAVGLFTLTLFAYLAAVYLTLETDDPALSDDFRVRAIVAGIVSAGMALVVYGLAKSEAPLIFRGLSSSPWGFRARLATLTFALIAMVALASRRFALARVAAIVQISLILVGCAMALDPFLVPPDRTIENSASPPSTLRLMLGAIGAGSVILFPSIYCLFRVFKSRRVDRSGP
jgi:cytochrome bd ubiquinol oxidase subunit II